VLCHEGLPLRQKGWPFLPHRDKNGIRHGCWECSTGLDKRSTEYYVDTIMRPAVSQNSHFAKRFAEIVRKTCREEQGTEVFHAHIWQKSVSVFAAKVCGNMCDPRQRFPATPSRHAGDVQRHRQARNSLQPFYCRELAAYKLKGLSGLNERQTFVAIAANLADKAHLPPLHIDGLIGMLAD
jgi:hypothetical protein